MRLPESDEHYLNDKGFKWALLPDGNGACLVLSDYELAGKFEPAQTDLMIRVPDQYNVAALDMFYADPPVRLRGSGQYPPSADVFEEHGGRRWQRFSRHLPTPWRPGVDGLPMFLTLIEKELRL